MAARFEAPASEPSVSIRLVCDVEKLSPGEEFALVAVFDISPGWHIYWQNSGDSGLPTRVNVTSPPGFEASAPIYPGPKRLRSPGGIENFVYEEEAALFIPMRAPLHWSAGPEALEFSAHGEWLICRELCYLQAGEDQLRVTGHAISTDDRASAKDLQRWRARLPRPMRELAGLNLKWRHEQGNPCLQVVVQGADEVEFFPGSRGDLRPRKIVTERRDDRLTVIYWRPADKGPSGHFVEGVLRVRLDGADRFYSIDATLESAGAGVSPD